jgi:hypothetical protein
LSLRAVVVALELDGHSIPFEVKPNESDQHLITQFPVSRGTHTLHVRYHSDFSISYAAELPALGHTSRGLRILAESWNPGHTELTLELEGLPGLAYDLSLFNGKEVARVEGGTIAKSANGSDKLSVTLPGNDQGQPVRGTLVLHFSPNSASRHRVP